MRSHLCYITGAMGEMESTSSVVPPFSVYLVHVLRSQLIVNLPRDTRSENTLFISLFKHQLVLDRIIEEFKAVTSLKHEMVTTAIRTEEPSES